MDTASILFVAALYCQTTVVNHTKTWNKMDRQTLDRAKTRCAYYYPSSPCLKKLIKLEEGRYHAICGRKR